MDVTKLPKWAQERIADLERELRQMTAHRNDLLPRALGNETSILVDYGHGTSRPFTTFEHVEYRIGSRGEKLSVALKDGKLHIHSSDGAVAVQPYASNAITVEIIPTFYSPLLCSVCGAGVSDCATNGCGIDPRDLRQAQDERG